MKEWPNLPDNLKLGNPTGLGVDPENNIVYVFLSNRTFPTMDNKLLSTNNIRTEIQRVIYESFN